MSHCTGYYVKPDPLEYPFEGMPEYDIKKPFWEAEVDRLGDFEGHDLLKKCEAEDAFPKEDDGQDPTFDPEKFAKACQDLKKAVDEELIPEYQERLKHCLAHPDREMVWPPKVEDPETVTKDHSHSDDEAIWQALEPRLRETTKKHIKKFFPIQRAVLPFALEQATKRWCDDGKNDEKMVTRRDLCVAAPTGSGKTLIYALTLLQCLVPRKCKRLRAIVIAPSRELARQIYKDMKRFVPEPEIIEKDLIPVPAVDIRCEVSKLAPQFNAAKGDIPDILVSTPGRLVDRLDDEAWQAKGLSKEERRYSLAFSIVHQLQYLIVDEADRLVEQEYQGWARKLLAKRAAIDHDLAQDRLQHYWDSQDWTDIRLIGRRPYIPTLPTKLRLRKLIFSATLGDDPRQLTSLRIENPLFFFVDPKQHSLITETCKPQIAAEAASMLTLSETLLAEDFVVAEEAPTKPLVLLALLEDDFLTKDDVAIVFCNAVDTVVRVAALLKLLFEDARRARIFELSSAANHKQRSRALREMKVKKDLPVIVVASDAASRGLDLPSVGLVLNYDSPNDPKTYVHRLGRTARAGNAGAAVTVLKKGQEAAFKRMRSNVDRELPTRRDLPRKRLSRLAKPYRAALANLKTKINDMRKAHSLARPTTTTQEPTTTTQDPTTTTQDPPPPSEEKNLQDPPVDDDDDVVMADTA